MDWMRVIPERSVYYLDYQVQTIRIFYYCRERRKFSFVFEKKGSYYVDMAVYEGVFSPKKNPSLVVSLMFKDRYVRVSKPFAMHEFNGRRYMVITVVDDFTIKYRFMRGREGIIIVDLIQSDKCPPEDFDGYVLACNSGSLYRMANECPPIRLDLSESYPVSYNINWDNLSP